MEIKISLIIPVYNTEKWLKECLDSVVNQVLPFDEVIIVNDGSTDSSLDICMSYRNKYNYFMLISQENKGQSAARNIGMEIASGDYIMFLDSDDYLRKDTVKLLKELLKKEQYDAIYFDADIHHTDLSYQVGRNIYDRSNSALDGNIWSGWEYFSRCYPRDYVVSVCMAVCRKKVIEDAELTFPEKVYYEDNYFSYMFLIYARKMIHISERLYQRRYRENSTITGLFSEKKFMDFIKICRLIWAESLKNNNVDLLHNKELLFSFFSDDYIRVLNNYQACSTENILLCDKVIDLFYRVSEDYLNIVDNMKLNISTLVLSDLCRITCIFHHIERWNLMQGKKNHFQIEKVIELQKKRYIDVLEKIPFNRKESKIGIYGTGKHTDGMLAIYVRLMGEIKSDLVFIDTRKDNEVYKDKDVINYRKIEDQNFDLIVISSFVYEREMIKRVREISPNIPVYTFYEILNRDIFYDYEFFLEHC